MAEPGKAKCEHCNNTAKLGERFCSRCAEADEKELRWNELVLETERKIDRIGFVAITEEDSRLAEALESLFNLIKELKDA